ncbi:hypothetical protein EDD21DRAFT_416003 [Dissophora ornata]|nr:hypothetical protein BGZ58_002080 [Dissophora ornata]KAI8600287.1 hypothetical protein EDD21DRAFT_416003 [Dissophora ornata]
MATREFDIILYGATGFTGFRTCQYLARNYKQGVRWAIAGRSIPKLEEVREKLVAIDPALSKLAIIKADASSPESLEAMTARTKKIIQKYRNEARDKNTIIIPQCGFDSVPSELGTKMVVDYLRKEYNLPTKSAKLSVTKIRGAGMMDSEESGSFESMMDQNQLVPEDVVSKIAPAKIEMRSAYYDYDFKLWQAFFVLSSPNEKLVKRSHGLQMEVDGVGYGSEFTYRESLSMPGFFTAAIATLGMGLAGAVVAIGHIRRFLLRHVLTAPGGGPSDEEIAKSHFTMKVVGESGLPENVPGDASSQTAEGLTTPIKVVAVVQGGDPGYSETCRYLAEGALCLVQNEDRIRNENKITGGVLTPAFAFGQILVDRLRAQNVNLTVSKL